MTDTDSSEAKPRCCIIYGWSEGRWHSKKMRRLLEMHGFEITKNADEADILIAHSMGCYLVPPDSKSKAILLIGLPYWPGRPVPLSVLLNTFSNIRSSWRDGSGWWLNKLVHNIWYILASPMATYHAMTRRKLSRLPRASAKRQVVLLRNAGDMFCHPDIARMLPSDLGYEYVNLEQALHEDCWLNPAPYIELAEKYYG
ncbi:MAG TPA: hypothetical protein VHA05_02530 [Candidatus Saccharimonadales bacterium]|nr:hypothetical protein [Candidatus Saccharimonadales bacterium]